MSPTHISRFSLGKKETEEDDNFLLNSDRDNQNPAEKLNQEDEVTNE